MGPEVKRLGRVLAREALTALSKPAGSLRFRRAIAHHGENLRLNVGAGPAPVAGWVNTDASWRNPLYLDVTRPWPVPPGRVSHVYGDNVIEHFPLRVGRQVLRNAMVALRPGGLIRLATPDVERTARIYLDDPAVAERHMRFMRGEGFAMAHRVDLLRVTFAECGHQLGYLYDFVALSTELDSAGFLDIRRVETGTSDEPAFVGLESRTNETCVATQLVVEARKPVTPGDRRDDLH